MNIEVTSKEGSEFWEVGGDDFTLGELEGKEDNDVKKPKRIGEEGEYEGKIGKDGANLSKYYEMDWSVMMRIMCVKGVKMDKSIRSSYILWVRYWN